MSKLILCLALLAGTVNAATYYVSPSGAWANDGSSGSPWNHPNRFNYSPAAAGDTLIFVTTSGVTEYDSCLWTLKNGSASAKTYWMPTNGIADRGEVICHSGRQLANSWTLVSGDIYYTSCNYGTSGTRWIASPPAGYSNVCAYQRVSGTVDSLLIPHANSTLSEGQSYYDEVNNRLYVRCYGGGSPGTKIRASTWPVIVSNQDYDHNYFIGLDLRGGYQATVVLGYGSSGMPSPLDAGGGGGDSNFFVHCNIGIAIETQSNNPCAIYHGNTYGASKSSWSQYCHVQACSITQSRGRTTSDGFHAGFGIELYAADNWVIDSNVFAKTGAGIGLKMGNVEDYGFNADSIKIRFNKIDQTHMTSAGLSSNGIWVGNKNKDTQIVGNIIRGCNIGILFAASTASGDCMEGGAAILNNTILDCGESMWQMTPCYNAGGNTIKYNLVCDSIGAFSTDAGAVSFRNNEYGTQRVDTFFSDVDYNQYYWGTNNFVGHFQSGSPCTGAYTFANWNSCGFDTHSDENKYPGLNTTTYAPSNATAMNVTHNGITWTQYGAIQPAAEATPVRIRARFR